jgi:hypothetical protein
MSRTSWHSLLAALVLVMVGVLATACTTTSSTSTTGTGTTGTTGALPTVTAAPTSTPVPSCSTLVSGSSPLGSIAHFPEVIFPAGTNPVALAPTVSGGGTGQFTISTSEACLTGTTDNVNGPFSAHDSLSATLFGAGWGLTPNSFPFDGQYHKACTTGQECYFSGVSVEGRQLEVDSLTDHGNHIITFHMVLAYPPNAPSCNANFTNSPEQGIQASTSTAYGTVPLPPLALIAPDASAGHGGTDVCSAGTVSTVTSFLTTYMPQHGWNLHSSSTGQQVWKSSSGCIQVLISDSTDWNISWPNPAGNMPFSDCT